MNKGFYEGLYHIGDVCSSRSKKVVNALIKALADDRIDVELFKEIIGDLYFLQGFGESMMWYAKKEDFENSMV